MDEIEQRLRSELTGKNIRYDQNEVEWLVAHIGDPNPDVRDGLVYDTFCVGVDRRRFSSEQLQFVAAYTVDNDLIMRDIEKHGAATVTRSFAALLNAELLKADRQGNYFGFLTDKQRTYMFDRAVRYLEEETDYTGYDPKLGWVHGIAHGADLLAECVQHQGFALRPVLPLLSKLLSELQEPLGDGEPARLAMVLFELLYTHRMKETRIADWLAQQRGLLRPDAHHFGQQALLQMQNHLYVALDEARDLRRAPALRESIQEGLWG
jgi:hypothetical protein